MHPDPDPEIPSSLLSPPGVVAEVTTRNLVAGVELSKNPETLGAFSDALERQEEGVRDRNSTPCLLLSASVPIPLQQQLGSQTGRQDGRVGGVVGGRGYYGMLA
jgi:hypothetical protein